MVDSIAGDNDLATDEKNVEEEASLRLTTGHRQLHAVRSTRLTSCEPYESRRQHSLHTRHSLLADVKLELNPCPACVMLVREAGLALVEYGSARTQIMAILAANILIKGYLAVDACECCFYDCTVWNVHKPIIYQRCMQNVQLIMPK